MSVYLENGYDNRTEYLKSLAQEYGVPYTSVLVFADLLGSSEDFDGLITILDDYKEE